MDGLPGGEVEPLAADLHALIQGAHQVHLHPPEVRVVEGPMAPGAEVEVRPQLAIDALQQVEVEGGGNPGGIVIGRIQHGRCLFQIDADQEQAAGADQLGHHGQEVGGPVRVEVADAGAGEEGHPRPFGSTVRHRHLAGEIGAGGMDLQPGELGGHLLGRHPQVLARDVHGHIGAGLEALEQQADLHATAAARLHQDAAGAHPGRDVGGVGLEDRDLGAGRVILRGLGNGVEELRAAGVVEKLGRDVARPAPQAREHLHRQLGGGRVQVLEANLRSAHGLGRAHRAQVRRPASTSLRSGP